MVALVAYSTSQQQITPIPGNLTLQQLTTLYNATLNNVTGNPTVGTVDAGLQRWNGNAWEGGLPYIVYQSAVQIIALPSGTMGNNGAFTLGTALDTTYSDGAYCFFINNAIYSGSPPGLYWCTFTTTTAGIVFNNQMTWGQPPVPVSPTAFVTTGPGAWTVPTSTGFPLIQAALLANAMGLNGRVDIECHFTVSPTTTNKRISVAIQGQAIFGSDVISGTTNTSRCWKRTLQNKGRLNRQIAYITNNVTTNPESNAVVANSTINTGISSTAYVQVQFDTAGTDWIAFQRCVITVTPSGAVDLSGPQVISAGSALIVPPGAAAKNYNTNIFFLAPQVSDVSFVTNNPAQSLWSNIANTGSRYTNGAGCLNLNRLGDGNTPIVVSVANNTSGSAQQGLLATPAMTNGCYIEVCAAVSSNNPDVWPAIYCMPYQHINGGDVLGGSPAGFVSFWELDICERIGSLSNVWPMQSQTSTAILTQGHYSYTINYTGGGTTPTLSVAWPGVTGAYPINSGGNAGGTATLTNGSTATTFSATVGANTSSNIGPFNTTFNNLSAGAIGPPVNWQLFNVYGMQYDPVGQTITYYVNGIPQIQISSTPLDAAIKSWNYYVLVVAQSHGLDVPYTLSVAYMSAWTP